MSSYKASADPQYKTKCQEIMNITGLDQIAAGKALIDAQGSRDIAIERHFNGTAGVPAGPSSNMLGQPQNSATDADLDL